MGKPGYGDPIYCSCGLRFQPFSFPDGTYFELEAAPHPDGVWAIVDGRPVVAVRFARVEGAASRVVGRLPEFETAPLFRSHYLDHANALARKAQGIAPKKATGS